MARDLRALADEDLMQLVRRGQAAAFEVIYERHASAAFSLAYRIVGTRNGAEDVSQEAFLSIWRSGARYERARGSVRTWVLGIVHHRAIDHIRRATVHDRRRAGDEGIEERFEAAERTDAEVARRTMVDGMIHDGLWDSFGCCHMGEYAEYTAEKAGVSRQDQDQFAYQSHMKALEATQSGKFKDEILPVQVPGKGGPTTIAADESPRKDTSPDTLAKLKPAFRKDGGTVTAGNAPGLNDGSSALVVASLAFAKAHGLSPLARVTGYATGGGEPREIFFAPVQAVRNLMGRTGTSIGDYDLIEANEAFAVQALADGRELGWDWDRVNVHGGAVALGHPIGASGARVLTTLLYALRDRGGSAGLATLCLGGGNAVALSVEMI